MIVAVTVVLGQWFVGRQLGFAFGINLSIARAGSYRGGPCSPTFARANRSTTPAGSRRCGSRPP